MRRLLVLALAGLLAGCSGSRVPPPPNPPRAVTRINRLLFAGDVMLSRGVRKQILAANDSELPFRKIAGLLAGADIAFINLESPFSDRSPYHEDGLIFHAAPEMIAGLQLAGIAIASTANNHARDCGPHGVDFTIRWLSLHGIAPVGSAESEAKAHAGVILVRNGIRFGFLAYTYDQSNGNWRDRDPRIALADPAIACRDISALRKRCDVVTVSMHHGIEYTQKPTKAQIEFAHTAIDAGATLVIGHHPHVIQPNEIYHGGVIFYSLGNFVFDQYQRQATREGEIVEVDFMNRAILFDAVWPVRITATGPQVESVSSTVGGL